MSVRDLARNSTTQSTLRLIFSKTKSFLSPTCPARGAAGVKRLLLKRFPYDIVVRELPEEIIVVAVAHQSRRPGYWQDRLQKRE
jgi:hypothetical protein